MTEPTAGPVNVEFEYLRVKDIAVSPSDLDELSIYESLDFPGITGRMIFKDYSDFKEDNKIFAGDLIEMKFKSRGDEEVVPLILKLAVYASYGDTPTTQNISNTVTLDFCSPWLIEGFTRKRSRAFYNMTIGDIIASLVHECSGNEIDDETNPYTDPLIGAFDETTRVLERFVSPYWTPIETIQHLMKQAISVSGFGGFVLWTEIYNEDAEGELVHFKPVTSLMTTEGSYGQIDFKLEMETSHQLSNRKIHDMSLEQSFDVIKYAKTGIGRSQLLGFDYDRGIVSRSDIRIDLLEQNHLSSKLPLNKKYLAKPYRETSYSFAYPNTTNLITTEPSKVFYDTELTQQFRPRDLIKGELTAKMAYMYSDMLKINAFVNGETTSKRVGALIEVVYPRVDQTQGRNEQYSGWYLIRNNRHVIQGMQYGNILTLTTDGYNTFERDDLITWNQQNPTTEAEEGDIYDVDQAVDVNEQQRIIEQGFADLGDLPWLYGTIEQGEE